MRPMTPVLGLWVCRTSRSSERMTRNSSRKAARSRAGAQERVRLATGTCVTPSAVDPLDVGTGCADAEQLVSGRDALLELGAEQERQAHVHRRQVCDAQ